MAQFVLIMTRDVPQLDILQLIPDCFVGVQVWRLARHLFHPDLPVCCAFQEPLDCQFAVGRQAIPDDQQLTSKLRQQVFQETHYIRPLERSLLYAYQQAPLRGYAADHREMIPRQRHMQHRGLATRRVAADHAAEQVEPGLVYPDDNPAFAQRLFLSAGQQSVCQAAMATSSRCAARTRGFCGVQPSCCKRRLTWAG